MKNLINKFIVFCLLPALLGSSIVLGNQVKQKPLIIFHIDMNSVSLKKEYLRTWLKNLADMGYNAVLWEIEDEVQWETCPECASPDAFTKKEFREILDYSRKLGLEPIPLLQTIAHAEYVLQKKKYIPFRENPKRYDCYCISNPEVREFLTKWIREYLDLFGDIRYFHLGGDEAHTMGTCPRCSAYVKKYGANALYLSHLKEIAKPILEKGIRPGVWDDMILKYPDQLSMTPKEFVLWDWDYWTGDTTPDSVMVRSKRDFLSKEEITKDISNQFPEILDESGNLRAFYSSDFLKNRGYDVILCSSSRSHLDGVFAGKHDLHAPNIIGAAKKTVQSELLGNCVTSWAAIIPNYETQQPWIYLAPLAIKYPDLSRRELFEKASMALFGCHENNFFEAISLTGYPFVFARDKSTGIMASGMGKDGLPAPPGYIKDLIEKFKTEWKKYKNGDKWKESLETVSEAPKKIRSGINLLNEFIPLAKKGRLVLNAWSLAGYFQYWQLVIAEEIVRRAEGVKTGNKQELLALLNSLRSEYKTWALTWMTPKSAEQNTGLIYDAIIEYIKSN